MFSAGYTFELKKYHTIKLDYLDPGVVLGSKSEKS